MQISFHANGVGAMQNLNSCNLHLYYVAESLPLKQKMILRHLTDIAEVRSLVM